MARSTNYTWRGKTISLVREEYVYDNVQGQQLIQEWEAHPNVSAAWYNGLVGSGINAKLLRGGGIDTILAYYGNQDVPGGTPEVPTIEWEHDTELVERSIFHAPVVQVEAATYPDGEAAYRQKIKKHFEDGDSFATFSSNFPLGTYPISHLIWRDLTRDAEYFEDSVQIVRRRRTASLRYAFVRPIIGARVVYTTAQLGLPVDIAWPITEPAAQPLTLVGWKLRGQSFSISGDRRTESIEFVLAAWSTLTHEAASGAYV